MIQYFTIEENGHSICCKLYGNEGAAARNVVLLCHGFGGSKEQVAGARFAETLVAERQDFCALAFDWPTHGTDGKQKLTLSDCDAYLGIVCRWMRDNWHPDRIFVYANSFGCYLSLKYISEHDDPFCRLVLRCPAVDMHAVLTRIVSSAENAAAFEQGNDVSFGFTRKIPISRELLEELAQNDVAALDFTGDAHRFLILQGTADTVVSVSAVRAFAEKNGIAYVPFEGVDHSFTDPAQMAVAIRRILDFFLEGLA